MRSLRKPYKLGWVGRPSTLVLFDYPGEICLQKCTLLDTERHLYAQKVLGRKVPFA
jgi:hypothetical protein